MLDTERHVNFHARHSLLEIVSIENQIHPTKDFNESLALPKGAGTMWENDTTVSSFRDFKHARELVLDLLPLHERAFAAIGLIRHSNDGVANSFRLVRDEVNWSSEICLSSRRR